ncbi:MAG: 7-carboxy-7-deazaguanine synthase QueE [Planctomycetes bacterium]|nr:7-carboxy-7-deazaguanine synthase QueE [Planctomycetota bacterium]
MRTETGVAPLVEAFVSVQGEGCLIGRPTFFVRTAGCPLRCTYCDTTESYRAPREFGVRRLDGETVRTFANPCRVEDLVAAIDEMPDLLRAVEWVSLTGGEPTLWTDFALELATRLRTRGLRMHLETAADDVGRFRPLVHVFDSVAMDYKLEGTLDRAPNDLQSQHIACLDAALRADLRVHVKVVLTDAIVDRVWHTMLERLRPFGRDFVLILQPVTPTPNEQRRLPAVRLLAMLKSALDAGFDARVLPQIHPLLGFA